MPLPSKFIPSYLKCLSSWPEDSDVTIKSIPSPYQVAKKINISANSSYKIWKDLFQHEYIRDLVLMPEVFPADISRFYLRVKLPLDTINSIGKTLSDLDGIEYVKFSNQMRLRKGNSSVKEYEEVANLQFLAEKTKAEDKIREIAALFEDRGLEFIPLNFFEKVSERGPPSSIQIKLMQYLCYKSINKFSTEEVTYALNFSRKKTRRVLDSIVSDHLVFSKPLYNFKKIPLMLARQININLAETDTRTLVKWVISQNEIKDNYIEVSSYPKGISLTVFGDTREEIENISTLISCKFDEVYVADQFETHFNYNARNYFSNYLKPETMKQ